MIDKLVTMKNTKIKIARIYLDYHEKTLFFFYAVTLENVFSCIFDTPRHTNLKLVCKYNYKM